MEAARRKSSLFGGVLFLAFCSTAASTPLDISLTDIVASHHRYLILDDGWRFKSGDKPRWSNPGFDDGSWLQHGSRLEPDELSNDPWVGIGWFRLRLTVDQLLADTPLVFYIHQLGASQMYVNGELVTSIGTVSDNPQQEVAYHETDLASYPITLAAGDNLLAVRYSDHKRADMVRAVPLASRSGSGSLREPSAQPRRRSAMTPVVVPSSRRFRRRWPFCTCSFSSSTHRPDPISTTLCSP